MYSISRQNFCPENYWNPAETPPPLIYVDRLGGLPICYPILMPYSHTIFCQRLVGSGLQPYVSYLQNKRLTIIEGHVNLYRSFSNLEYFFESDLWLFMDYLCFYGLLTYGHVSFCLLSGNCLLVNQFFNLRLGLKGRKKGEKHNLIKEMHSTINQFNFEIGCPFLGMFFSNQTMVIVISHIKWTLIWLRPGPLTSEHRCF